jgi:hypothetical protein
MALHQSWAHGNAFAPPELPANGLYPVDNVRWTDITGLRRGWGSFWLGQPGTSNWFHVPIPTPTIVEGARVQLQRVFVLFTAGDTTATAAGQSGANITNIHVWDGPNRIATFGPFNLFGEHRQPVGGGNTFTVQAKPQITFGVGISVQATFSNVGDQLIGFAGAGADFDI